MQVLPTSILKLWGHQDNQNDQTSFNHEEEQMFESCGNSEMKDENGRSIQKYSEKKSFWNG